MSLLYYDCLNKILEYLEDYKVTLFSCLLVNRLWCEVAVRILWRNGLRYNATTYITLIACLPNESKEILCNNRIIIPIPTSKPPMFNYAAFCKKLSLCRVDSRIDYLLRDKIFISLYNLNDNICIVKQEIFKMFMKQISSLKYLDISIIYPAEGIENIYTIYPGAKNFFENLSELLYSSNISNTHPDLFYQLSQICHNLSSLKIIYYDNIILNGLINIISVQKNLKCFEISSSCDITESEIIPSSAKLPNTLIKLILDVKNYNVPLPFIIRLTNLQELVLTATSHSLKELQYATFSQLKILRISFARCDSGLSTLIRIKNFIQINGIYLRECYVDYSYNEHNNNPLNKLIATFCPNLRKISVGFKNDELETLKFVFNNCQCLESIRIWCGGVFLSERNALEMVVKFSPKNVYELNYFIKVICYQNYCRKNWNPFL